MSEPSLDVNQTRLLRGDSVKLVSTAYETENPKLIVNTVFTIATVTIAGWITLEGFGPRRYNPSLFRKIAK